MYKWFTGVDHYIYGAMCCYSLLHFYKYTVLKVLWLTESLIGFRDPSNCLQELFSLRHVLLWPCSGLFQRCDHPVILTILSLISCLFGFVQFYIRLPVWIQDQQRSFRWNPSTQNQNWGVQIYTKQFIVWLDNEPVSTCSTKVFGLFIIFQNFDHVWGAWHACEVKNNHSGMSKNKQYHSFYACITCATKVLLFTQRILALPKYTH